MKSVSILLVEDNEGDIFLTTEAFNEPENNYWISVAKDGWKPLMFYKRPEFQHCLISFYWILISPVKGEINYPPGLCLYQPCHTSDQALGADDTAY